MLKEHSTVPEVKKAINILGDISTDPDMQELVRRRMNNEIYKQSVVSAAKNEGRAEGRAERDAEIAANLKTMGMSEETIKIALARQGTAAQENQKPQVQNKSTPKRGRR